MKYEYTPLLVLHNQTILFRLVENVFHMVRIFVSLVSLFITSSVHSMGL